MQSAVEWLFNELWNTDKDKFTWHSILKKAKEMEDNSPKVQNKDSFGEISDEEIEEQANIYSDMYDCPSIMKLCKHDLKYCFIHAIKWYKKQLKSKE